MKSIMHKKDGTCYLCMKLDDNYRQQGYVEEHHVINGKPGRKLSERYGLKVYLCVRHHRSGLRSVHVNHDSMMLVKAAGQEAFEKTYPDLDWMSIFGKNYKE